MRTLDVTTKELVEIVELPLDKFGCDCMGTYWKPGAKVWNALGATIDVHVRAHTYETAKALVLASFPDIIVYTGR